MLSHAEISDRLEIQQLIVDYSTAIDTRHFDDLDAVFTQDAYIDYTALGGIEGRYPEVKAWLAEVLPNFPMYAHMLGNFSVRIDRIDRLSDGARLLIDYKTGAPSRDWQGERPDNPQLPIYALLHSKSLIAVAYGKINAAECAFIAESERNGVFPRKRASRMEGLESLAELLDRWSERIERLAKQSGFAGRLVILAEPEIETGDCRIEWADGGVVLERAAIEAKISELVGRYMASRGQAKTTARGLNHG